MRRPLFLAVFVALCAGEALMVACVDTSTAPVAAIGRPFHVDNVAPGTVFSQRFEVRADDLNEVRLKGRMSAGDSAAVLRAQVAEIDIKSTAVRVQRTGQVSVPAGQTECCAFRFAPIPDSRWRSYRIDLTVERLGNRQLSLWLVPEESTDRLFINARRKRASLVLGTSASTGTGWRRLAAGSSWLARLVPLALIYNAAFALMVSVLLTASDPRHA
jgi:hypothetical protein